MPKEQREADVFRTSKTTAIQENAAAAAELARQLAADKKFRKQLLRASGHAASANRRIRSRLGLLAAFRQITTDQQLRAEFEQLMAELKAAWKQAERKRHHRLRNSLLVVAGAGAATVVTASRSRHRLRKTEELRDLQTQEQTEAQQAA
jgi:hypothetical protein